MASNAYFAYVFVGAWLASDRKLRPEDMAVIMKDVLYKMHFFRLTDLNKNPKKRGRTMKKYDAWYAKGNGRKYPSTWHVHFDEARHKDGSCYYFTSCLICSCLNFLGQALM